MTEEDNKQALAVSDTIDFAASKLEIAKSREERLKATQDLKSRQFAHKALTAFIEDEGDTLKPEMKRALQHQALFIATGEDMPSILLDVPVDNWKGAEELAIEWGINGPSGSPNKNLIGRIAKALDLKTEEATEAGLSRNMQAVIDTPKGKRTVDRWVYGAEAQRRMRQSLIEQGRKVS